VKRTRDWDTFPSITPGHPNCTCGEADQRSLDEPDPPSRILPLRRFPNVR